MEIFIIIRFFEEFNIIKWCLLSIFYFSFFIWNQVSFSKASSLLPIESLHVLGRKRLFTRLDQYCVSLDIPEPLSSAGTAAVSHRVLDWRPVDAYTLLVTSSQLCKERPIGQIKVWLRSHNFSQKSDDIHVPLPGSSWECLFEQKILSVQKPPPAWAGWELLKLSNACSKRGGGRRRGMLPAFGWPAGIRAALFAGEVWGKGRVEKRPLSCWETETMFDRVHIKGYVSTFPLVLLKSLEPLKDPAGCLGTTDCRIEPR